MTGGLTGLVQRIDCLPAIGHGLTIGNNNSASRSRLGIYLADTSQMGGLSALL